MPRSFRQSRGGPTGGGGRKAALDLIFKEEYRTPEGASYEALMQDQSKFIYVPCYIKKKGEDILLRLLPSIDPESGEPHLQLNPEPVEEDENAKGLKKALAIREKLGNGARLAAVARMWGPKNLTFLAHPYKDDANNAVDLYYDPLTTIRNRLYWKREEQLFLQSKNAHGAMDVPESWHRRLLSEKDYIACPSPDLVFLFQSVLFERMGKEIEGGRGRCVFAVAAGQEFLNLLTSPANKKLVPPHLVRDDGSVILDPDSNSLGSYPFWLDDEPDALPCVVQVAKVKRGDTTRYEITTQDVKQGSEFTLSVQDAKDLWVEWEDFLEVPTIEQVLKYGLDVYTPEMMDYGCRKNDVLYSYLEKVEAQIREDDPDFRMIGTADSIQDEIHTDELKKRFKEGLYDDVIAESEQKGRGAGGFRRGRSDQEGASQQRQSFRRRPAGADDKGEEGDSSDQGSEEKDDIRYTHENDSKDEGQETKADSETVGRFASRRQTPSNDNDDGDSKEAAAPRRSLRRRPNS
jgi:hypothetical protein